MNRRDRYLVRKANLLPSDKGGKGKSDYSLQE